MHYRLDVKADSNTKDKWKVWGRFLLYPTGSSVILYIYFGAIVNSRNTYINSFSISKFKDWLNTQNDKIIFAAVD